MKVFVYRNLHKKCWSVKALSGPHKGLVIAHLKELTLVDCIFRVSEAGRQRVIKTKRKNVHAGVVGYLTTTEASPSMKKVRYNPYEAGCFKFVETKEPIHKSSIVRLDDLGAWV